MFKEIPLPDNVVILSVGSNLGNKLLNIESAYHQIAEKLGLSKIYHSPVIETTAWGYQSENTFYNSAVAFESDKTDPLELLKVIQNIEKEIGRVKKSIDGVYTDRVIDLDIIFFGNTIFKSETLEIPHPKMKERSFVLVPIGLLDAPFLFEGFHSYIQELIKNCSDKTPFKLIAEV